MGQSFGAIPVPDPPVVRRGASGSFYDKGPEGASHHAVIPNVNTIDRLPEVWPRLSSPDEKKLFDVIARAYLAALMPALPADDRNARRARESVSAAFVEPTAILRVQPHNGLRDQRVVVSHRPAHGGKAQPTSAPSSSASQACSFWYLPSNSSLVST